MKYIELKNVFDNYSIFSLNDIRKRESDFDVRRISEWIDKGYIKQIIKGQYVFCDKSIDENDLFYISNKLSTPSYISLQSALSFYGLIPEGVFSVTAVSSKRKIEYRTPYALFTYNKIKPSMFFGYNIVKKNNNEIKIANPEKSLIDLLYLNSTLNSEDDFCELRLNIEIARKIIRKTIMKNYLRLIKDRKLSSRVNLLLTYIYND